MIWFKLILLISSVSIVFGLSSSKSTGREGVPNPPKVPDEEANDKQPVIFSEGGPVNAKPIENVTPKTTKTIEVKPIKNQPKISPAQEVQVKNSSIVARKGVPDDIAQPAPSHTPINSTLPNSSEATPINKKDNAPGPKKFSLDETLDEIKTPMNADAKSTVHIESTTEAKKTSDVTSQTINKTESSTVSTKATPVVKISTTALPKKHKPKPTATFGEDAADRPFPVSPTRSSPLGMPRKIDYIVPVVITLMALPLLSVAAFVLYRRGRDCWDKRHYRRMDFLIDGMYND